LNLPLTQIIIISYVLAFGEFNLSQKKLIKFLHIIIFQNLLSFLESL